ncbi:MAG: YdcF family protein [Acidobacteria bacterium]|nr:YdcF family protein [Acidobacteriota bacterium]
MLGLGLVLGAVTTIGAGRLLVRLDPIDTAQPADAIFVLGGTRADRWLEAVELYNAGAARAIVLSRGGTEPAEQLLAARGIQVPNDGDIGRGLMIAHLGVPESAVSVLPVPVDNTAQEADAILAHARQHGWTHIIVITSSWATRRAGYAFHRTLGEEVRVTMRAPRFDTYDPVWWWQTRSSFRQTFYEVPKLLAYWLGLGA